MPSDSFKIQAHIHEIYDEGYTGQSPWRELGGKYKAKNLMEVCRRADVQPKRVLEVGAGEGSVLLHLDKAGYFEELNAVEIATSGIDVIKSRELASLKSAELFDGYSLPYEDNAFDAVILCHVLEHVEYERILLRELMRVAPYQIIEVPLDYHFEVDTKVDHYLGYGHINMYTPSSLRFLLKSEGFDVVEEILEISHEDVVTFNEFINKKTPKTKENEAALKQVLRNKRRAFYDANKEQAEMIAESLTILTKRGKGRLNIREKQATV
ncbi:MAG: class I SAM-dependent methyltransferase [Rhodospirillaceae bacterium]|jgi:ubiquinone/menaquinone biosynthesis C-methylase UbiE|nr:class I SAM-dependent methyltransferase [Rhodospirillaceae bacterium]MBT5242489.1 class I SAM-dependent methyltransferase [Rhodospirillaceae bacterium]MBT5566444.1 class I SAM-dependent methyltransferase [Rhodospirillaceae bacterium]MBT6088288.1 class I SAM-dependent methyltransferase [Rhodospirillaceae bacterium]MBT7450184.1 class I SAM-dependent methyltransferase [Rhodospirillaceae bacterium]